MRAKRMGCPLCEATVVDDAELTAHLGEAHDLYDDEGARPEPASAADVSPEPAPAAVEDLPEPLLVAGIPADRVYDPSVDDAKWRPVVILLCLLLLAAGLAVVSLPSGGNDDEQAASSGSSDDVETVGDGDQATTVPADPASTSTTVAASLTPASTSTTVASPGATTATTPAPAPPPPAPVPGPPAPPPTTTAPPTTAPPPPTSPPPPPAFAPPSATDARLDDCQRSGSVATWGFSYVLSGGSGWSPAPGSTTSGGRTAETRTGRAQDGFAVSSVVVVDQSGGPHTIPLQPPLAADRCR